MGQDPATGALRIGPLQALPRLAELAALTCLALAGCGLRCIPPELGTLPLLAELDASQNPGLAAATEEQRDEALAPLRLLPALRRLNVRNCELPATVPVLAELADRGVSVLAN